MKGKKNISTKRHFYKNSKKIKNKKFTNIEHNVTKKYNNDTVNDGLNHNKDGPKHKASNGPKQKASNGPKHKASDGPKHKASDGPKHKACDEPKHKAIAGPNTSLIVQHYELFEDPPPHKDKEMIKFGKEYLLESSASLDDFDVVDEEQKQEEQRKAELTEEQDQRIRQIYKERKQFLKNVPLLCVKEVGDEASLSVGCDVRYPLFYPDIEDLISFVQGKLRETRWIHIKKMGNMDNVIVISVEGVGLDDYEKYPVSLGRFSCQAEFVSPLTYDTHVESCIASKLDPSCVEKPYLGFQTTGGNRDGFVAGLDSLFNINFNKGSSENQSNTLSSKTQLESEPETERKKRKSKRNETKIEEEISDGQSKSFENGDNLEDEVRLKGVIDNVVDEVKSSEISKSVSETERNALEEAMDKVSTEFDLHANTLKRILKEKDKCLLGEQVLPIAEYHRDNFSRLDLVMTPREMANEKYPLPFSGSRYAHFVKTKDEYTAVTNQSPMFGLDCEMCMTSAGNELTRISIVNEKHEVVYEKLVKPYNPIWNYLTKYSGITKKMLQDVTTRLPDVQREVKLMLPPDAILVGQSLNGDLIAMQMMHPYVIDSSCIYNLTGYAKNKTKLKTLCAEFLSRAIQLENRVGHDSIEDSIATLELVQEKLKHSLTWGNVALGFNRTEAESRAAHIKLLENSKKPLDPDDKAKLAVNSKVDTPHVFAPPICKKKLLKKVNKLEEIMKDAESWKAVKRKTADSSQDKSPSESPRRKKRRVEAGLVQENPVTQSQLVDNTGIKMESSEVDKVKCMSVGDKVECKEVDEAKDSGIEDMQSDNDKLTESDRLIAMQNQIQRSTTVTKAWPYQKVTIIGSEEVVDRYKKHLPEKDRQGIEFVNVDSSKSAVKRVILSDIQPTKQLILAHISTNSITKVNKWCEEIFGSIKSNDLLCWSLNGRVGSNDKGAFFATVPGSSNIPPVREVIDQYLKQQGVKS